eukprot:1180698-Prorocentrum_minimum.AAC.1
MQRWLPPLAFVRSVRPGPMGTLGFGADNLDLVTKSRLSAPNSANERAGISVDQREPRDFEPITYMNSPNPGVLIGRGVFEADNNAH